MSTITIRGIDETTARILKERAKNLLLFPKQIIESGRHTYVQGWSAHQPTRIRLLRGRSSPSGQVRQFRIDRILSVEPRPVRDRSPTGYVKDKIRRKGIVDKQTSQTKSLLTAKSHPATLTSENQISGRRMFYEELFEKLNKSGVDYVVVGGVALVLHGVVRLTADLDLMVHLEEGNLSKFVDIMNELGYRPKVPVKSEEFINAKTRATWINEKNMKVFSFFHPERAINLVDVFVEEPVDYNVIISDTVTIMSGSVSIPVVSVKNLIKLKEISGRPQDIADIAALREIQKSERR